MKGDLFALLDAPARAGMTLTEHYAMRPAASVAGFYFSHPESRYFAIPKIGEDPSSPTGRGGAAWRAGGGAALARAHSL